MREVVIGGVCALLREGDVEETTDGVVGRGGGGTRGALVTGVRCEEELPLS